MTRADSSPKKPQFQTTSWSLVVAAAAENRSGDEESQSMHRLCELYWFPIYCFVRRSGYDRTDAEDLTQSFFVQLLDKNFLDQADAERGRFRTFLLAAIKNFLSNQRQKNHALKRGGGVTTWNVDFAAAAEQYGIDPADDRTPEVLFHRQWAMTVLRNVLEALGNEYSANGKGEWFEALSGCLTGEPEKESMKSIADRLGVTTSAVKVALHRMRKSYRDRLAAEVSATVGDGFGVHDEREQLLEALRE